MSERNWLEEHKVIHLSTEAMRDRWDGGWASDVISMKNWRDIVFIIDQTSGVGAAELTVRSANDVVPTTTSGISGGRYRVSTTPDTWGSWTNIPTSSGFVTAITPDKTYEIHVRSDELSGNDTCVFLDAVESTNSSVDVNCIAVVFNPRYASDIEATVLTT